MASPGSSPKEVPEEFRSSDGKNKFADDKSIMSHWVNAYERRLQEIEDMDVEIGRTLD